jgi:hypothetical protein
MHELVDMAWRCCGLSLLIICWVFITHALRSLSETHNRNLDSDSILTPTDPESQFAMGHHIPLACADLPTLELIPGVSDTLASSIMIMRPEILYHAAQGESFLTSWELAHGVGPASARRLDNFFNLSGTCPTLDSSLSRVGPSTE